MIPNPPVRVVLDTNVMLDLFVFRDPRWRRLLEAMQGGAVEAVTRADCKMEWSLVLAYDHLKLDEARRAAIEAEAAALVTLLEAAPLAPPDVKLPVCRDPDDQKFLELAQQAEAAVLISKDKALLKLARKAAKLGLFRILPPEAWVAEMAPAPGTPRNA